MFPGLPALLPPTSPSSCRGRGRAAADVVVVRPSRAAADVVVVVRPGGPQPGKVGQNGGMSFPDAQETPIRDEMIRLGQLLKLANLAEDGIQAKQLIEDGLVKVNGDIEERRGRQLHAGDVVSVNGETVRIVRES